MIAFIIATLLQKIGLSLAVGSSTYAITFYFKALADGVINDTEREFMHTVYFVLRIGMGLILFGELALGALLLLGGSSLAALFTSALLFKIALFAAIGSNAFLMHLHKMPMGFGPAIAGGSWYMFLIVDTLKDASISLPLWIGLYVSFIGGFTILLRTIKPLTKKRAPAAPAPHTS